jgi:hypothetical protein
MLVRQLVGSNAGMIHECELQEAETRVASGSYEMLTDEEMDSPAIVAKIGKVPSAPVADTVASRLVSSDVVPGGYKIELDTAAPRVMWLVYARNGRLIRYMPYPNRMAAIEAAEAHRVLSRADQRAMEDQADADRVAYEAHIADEEARRRSVARTGGFG